MVFDKAPKAALLLRANTLNTYVLPLSIGPEPSTHAHGAALFDVHADVVSPVMLILVDVPPRA
jgi:hypothetical protein